MKNKFTVWTVTTIAVLMGAWLVFAGVQTKDTAGGLFIGMNASDLIGFHGATPVTQAVLSAAIGSATNTTTSDYSTNNVAAMTNVAIQTVSLTGIATNIALQTRLVTNLDLNGTTNIISYVTNATIQVVVTEPVLTNLVATTQTALARAGTITNTTAGSDATLVNQIRSLLINKGLGQ